MNIEKWNKLNNKQKNYICISQKLDTEFIEQIWNKLDKEQRNSICIFQKLDIEFIKQHWNELDEKQRNIIKNESDNITKLVLLSLEKGEKENEN